MNKKLGEPLNNQKNMDIIKQRVSYLGSHFGMLQSEIKQATTQRVMQDTDGELLQVVQGLSFYFVGGGIFLEAVTAFSRFLTSMQTKCSPGYWRE